MRVERRYEASAEAWPDLELVQHMRRGEPAAIREFYRRFTPVLWKEARRAHVYPALRDDVVNDCLGDGAMRLMRPEAPVPASLTAYLITALRNRMSNDRRAARRRATLGAASAAVAHAETGERVVREACSEASLRASAGPAFEAPPLSPVLARLWSLIDGAATSEEHRLMRWLAASVPQSLAAEWLGITHNAARVRALRLRDRLMGVALRSGEQWAPEERRELYAFLRRCGCLERARGVLERSRASPPRNAGTGRGDRGSSQEEP